MTGYRKIDMAAWPRREHYQYYTEKLKIECNMTVPINVKNLLDFCHESGHKFYPSIIYLVTKVLNQMEMRREIYVCGIRWYRIIRFFMRMIKPFPIAGRAILMILKPFTEKSQRIWKRDRRKEESR